MSRHTEGPWHYDVPGIVGKRYEAGGQRTICKVVGYPSGEDEANMRLISAAPDLLEALRLATLQMRTMRKPVLGEPNWPFLVEMAEAAIVKATGANP